MKKERKVLAAVRAQDPGGACKIAIGRAAGVCLMGELKPNSSVPGIDARSLGEME